MMDFNNENLVHKEKDGLEYIQFRKLLDLGIKHAYTLKSENIDFSFNQDLNLSSYEKLCNAIGIDFSEVVQPVQTHTDKVKCIDRVMKIDELQNVDGLITNKKNIALTSKNADCIIFLFYDPIKKVIANVHSGWRGTFQKIAEKAVVKMINFYGCKPEDILCFICPSIRKDHFEVDEDVKELCETIFGFLDYDVDNEAYNNIRKSISKDGDSFTNYLNKKIKETNTRIIQKGNIIDNVQKYNIDTVLINKLLLLNLGLKEENIIDSELCSACNGDKIESVRIDKEKSKRATAIIVL